MKRKLLMILAFSSAVAGVHADDLSQTKDALSKWVETRKLISEEKQKWELERETLRDQIDLIHNERDSLTKKINETQSQITDADKKREDLVEQNDALKNASATLVKRITTLEQGVLDLLPTLPQPVQDRLKPLSQRIPKSDKTDLTLSERYQNVIGIINELNKSANNITVVSETRNMPDGTKAEVQTLYIGFACAYYCNTKGNVAGAGHPSADGWKWEANNTIAPKVAEAIAVLKNEKVAEFIPLPVTVD